MAKFHVRHTIIVCETVEDKDYEYAIGIGPKTVAEIQKWERSDMGLSCVADSIASWAADYREDATQSLTHEVVVEEIASENV